MAHSVYRPRRLREKSLLRKIVRETSLAPDDFMYPLFITHGRGVREAITSMPGQYRLSIDEAIKEAKDTAGMGTPAVLLFGIPDEEDARGSGAYADDGHGGAPRGRARHRRGGGHRDGEARAAVPRHHLAGEGRFRDPARRVFRLRRVRDDPRGGPARLARRGARDDGGPDLDPARRR